MSLLTEDLVAGRYRLGERLGGTGERRTWLAVDEQTGERVVFKSLFFGQTASWQQYQLFEREADVLPRLEHPCIPKFQAAFWLEQPEGHYFCLVQRYVPGISLREWLSRGNRFNAEKLVGLAADLLAVLECLHSQQPPLVHQDIKPSNLILGDDGRVHLIDFGAVQAMGQESRTLTATGTFGYMAPEQFLGRAVPASDLYGLGATLLNLLTGKSPAESIGYDGSLRLPEHPILSGWFGRWLARMVAPDPERRFLDARAARIALDRTEVEAEVPTPPLSRLGHFLVLETNEVRTRVRLSMTLGLTARLIIAGVFLTIAYLPPPLWLALMTGSALLWLLMVWNDLLGPGNLWIQIDLKGGNCRLHRGFGPLTFYRRSLPISSDSTMQLVRQAAPRWFSDKPRSKLRLQLGAEKCEFAAYLDDDEVQWLIARFDAHRDRLYLPLAIQKVRG